MQLPLSSYTLPPTNCGRVLSASQYLEAPGNRLFEKDGREKNKPGSSTLHPTTLRSLAMAPSRDGWYWNFFVSIIAWLKIMIITIIVSVYACATIKPQWTINQDCICEVSLRISCHLYFISRNIHDYCNVRLLKTRQMVTIRLLLAKLSQFSWLIE